jgi:flavin-dependent dehydrogenase
MNGITDRSDYDVVVMGGGLAGLSFARQMLMRRPQTTVLVVERLAHPVPEATHKVGEATVELSANYFAHTLGLLDHLEQSQIRKMGLRFFPSAAVPPPPLSRRAETGPSDYLAHTTYQLDRGIFENALGEAAVEVGAEFRHGCRVAGVDLDPAGSHTVTISRGDERVSVQARWVVDASGRRAIIKNKLGLHQPVAHDCNAVWLRLSEMISMDTLIEYEQPPPSEEAIASWNARVPNGQRWRSTNHLMGRGYWAWLIPLASGSISVGLVFDPEHVALEDVNTLDGLLRWMEVHEPELGRAVESRRDSLQDFHMLRHFAHGCTQVFSGDRWALTGEAGVFTDPLYSPGSDFIAISNTFVVDMVDKDLAGMPIAEVAAGADALYLGAFQSFLPMWEKQYGLMGNPQVWSAKSVWDLFSYMAVPGIIANNGRLTDIGFMVSAADDLGGFFMLCERMQGFFREWDEADPGVDEDRFVDVAVNVEAVWKFAQALAEQYELDALREKMRTNIAFTEDVVRVIMAHAATRAGHPTDPVDVDPLTFTIDGQAGESDGPPPGAGRETSIARADEMLQGLWYESSLVREA